MKAVSGVNGERKRSKPSVESAVSVQR
jgi:hypothetical protein